MIGVARVRAWHPGYRTDGMMVSRCPRPRSRSPTKAPHRRILVRVFTHDSVVDALIRIGGCVAPVGAHVEFGAGGTGYTH